MLSEKIINQVKARIDSINNKLRDEANQALSSGKSYQEVFEQLTAHAVREFTPESKMLMDSVYNVLSNETLQTEFFQVTAHEVAFNKKNIQKNIASHFSFEVPDSVEFKKDYHSELWGPGGVVVLGGVVGFIRDSIIPVGMAAVLAFLMYNLIKKSKEGVQKQIIAQYLISTRDTLVRWLESIAEYYNQQVEALKAEIKQQEDR